MLPTSLKVSQVSHSLQSDVFFDTLLRNAPKLRKNGGMEIDTRISLEDNLGINRNAIEKANTSQERHVCVDNVKHINIYI